MHLLAFAAVVLLWLIGWTIIKGLLQKWIAAEDRIYFAPAIGIGACGSIAYIAARTHLSNVLIPSFALVALLFAFRYFLKTRPWQSVKRKDLFWFVLGVFILLYGMQLSLFYLFKDISRAPHEVWNVFNLSGVSPPDQMFAWHQAMFVNQHRHYPIDPFYADMDLYDRPHLGGYVTLFLFKLFHLPLREHHDIYPEGALRFYHCLWWLLNNLYLLGIAPLFRHLLGYRAAMLAVAATALSGFILLCNVGGWVRFAALYPLLLAILLFCDGKGPVLQALLCATSYYLHGSVLPFLLGFGLFQILCLFYPIRPGLAHLRDVASFAIGGVILVGAWFLVVRWVGSKQPLLYYYIYDAGLTQAQTEPVTQIAQAFYASHTWSSLSLLPLHNLIKSIVPIHVLLFLPSLISWKVANLGAMLFESQRFCVLAAAGITALPIVLIGLKRTLASRYAGRTILAFYLVPTLFMALVYRKDWSFSLHIMCLYHTFVLFFWVLVLKTARSVCVTIALAAIALEGMICVLFADNRFLPVDGLQLGQITTRNWFYLAAYLSLVALMLCMTILKMRQVPSDGVATISDGQWLVVGRKLLIGLLIAAVTIASYSLYCLRFY